MASGIDIYRYQTVTDWGAVKRAGVTFVYVKGTDGGGLAPVHADGQVRGAQGVQIPVGLYHYAQLSPSPETQADVLTAEVRRLGATGMPPALDLEAPFGPNTAARQFAQRFLNRLRANGFPVVTLYANTSMLAGIGADTLGVPGLKIWAANYGVNDGKRHSYSYSGHVDIHQYTSSGRVAGITGLVDMNESLTNITSREENDMLTGDDGNVQWAYQNIYTQQIEKKKIADWLGENNSISRHIVDTLGPLVEKVDQVSTGGVDTAAVAAAVVAQIRVELAPLFDLAQRLQS